MLSNIDAKQLTVLVALVISGASNTVSHLKLSLKRLEEEFGVGGLAFLGLNVISLVNFMLTYSIIESETRSPLKP